MLSLNQILAKSVNYGGVTLLEHTQQVVEAIEVFAAKYQFNFNVETAKKGAILHDLGKAHPYFQRRMQNINARSLYEERENNYTHRHEISSLAFLPCFPKSEWNDLIEMVVAHHKPIENDPRGRGILDLLQKDRDLIPNHLKDWDEWNKYGFQILQHFDLPICEVSIEDAGNAIRYAIEFCENISKGYSPLRGLLKSADHFASAFTHETEERLKPLFEIPDTSYYHDEKRKNNLYPLSQINSTDNRQHTLVVAPTGAGKTDFLLRRCKGRVFYTLPYQASINAMWERMKATVPNKDIRLLHATSKIVAMGKEEQILQPFAGSAIKVLTPHQLAAIIFGTSGFETVMLDVQGTDIILDEIHTYSDFSRAMVLEIVKALLRLDCKLHIGTATMPSVLYNELLQMLGGENAVYQVSLPNELLDTFNRHQIDKIEDEEAIASILKQAFENKEKVLVIYNTVGKAQAAYKRFIEAFPNVPKMLIHSRFKRGDRVELETKLKTDFNGDENTTGYNPCLVVSTQVVEVSLDISFDRMITQCAPLDGMIQRFGRVNRKRTHDTIGKYKPIHIIKPSGNVLPYKLDILQASFNQLPNNFEVLSERSLQAKIDAVYPILETKEIDVHLIYRNDKYIINKLTDNKKAILVEALEIESATCILEHDMETYLTANWEDRVKLEIPINYKTISKQIHKYIQLQVGAYPFVVPQNQSEYEKFGLQLEEHDVIL